MSEQKFDEMIYAYSAGCLDNEDLLEFLEFSESGGKLNERKLGELQNLSSLLPLILEIEMPHPQVRDKFARRLFRLRDEVRVKAKASQRNPIIETPVEVPQPVEEIQEEPVKEEPKPVEIKKDEFKKPEFRKQEFRKEEPKKEEFKKVDFKKEEIKTEDKKPEIPSKKPEVNNKKFEVVDKKEPVKTSENKEKFLKEDKKNVPEKEIYKPKETVAEKPITKDKYNDKIDYSLEEEEGGGFGKYIIIGIAAVVIIGVVIFFMTRGGSSPDQAANQQPVDSTAIKAKQEQIQKLNEQLANIQNGGQTSTQTGTNDPEQKKVDELTKQLQALKEEMTKMNQAKTSSQPQVQPTQQAQAQPRNDAPAVEQSREDKPVAAQTQATAAPTKSNDNAPAAASEVRRTEEPQTYNAFAEEMPSPVGGMPNMLRKVNVPEKAINAGVQGKVFVKAYIDENGNVTRTSIAKGLGYGCDEVAEFVVKSTKFVPGKNKGKSVKVEMLIPVPFKL